MEFRIVRPADERLLAELFTDIDESFFRPHPFTRAEAHRIAHLRGQDIYAILVDGDRGVAYGMLRGWDEGYDTPSLGVAVRTDSQSRGLGLVMMSHLHYQARLLHASERVRLRVHRENVRARRLYETLGYEYRGEERGELVMARDLGEARAPSGRLAASLRRRRAG